jgi:hypothetical protein
VGAQDPTGCDAQLEAAEAQYVNGAFNQAISAASTCLSQPATTPGEAVRAYRTLALAHVKLNELQPARQAVVNLLGVDPDYTADRVNDPPVFVSMVSLVKRSLQLGTPALPVQRVQPLQPSPNSAIDARRLRSIPAASPTPDASDEASFFRQANTWLTLGGIMIGGSAQSGRHSTGIGVGAIGVGAGGEFTGLGVGGLMVGGGEALEGIMVGGLVVGSGDRLDGIAIGGGGVGTGGRLRGLAVGGLGVGSGKAIRGIALGGLGVGTGGDLSGVGLALLGVGGRGAVDGFTAAGLGIGAGSHLRGLHIAGLGIVTTRMAGVTLSGIMVGNKASGGVVAPVYSRITNGGHLKGVSVSLFNHVQGDQRGLTIGLFNVARSLHGVQLGALNWAGNNPLLLRLLPLINVNL